MHPLQHVITQGELSAGRQLSVVPRLGPLSTAATRRRSTRCPSATTLAAARETAGLSRRGGRRGDPDPPHPASWPSRTTTSRPAAATSTPAATSAPSPATRRARPGAAARRVRRRPDRAAARPRATEVFESETAARPERRAAPTGAPRWPPRSSWSSASASCRRSPAPATASDDDRPTGGRSTSSASRRAPAVAHRRADRDRRRQRGRPGAARQGDRRRAGHRPQLGPGHDRERPGAVPGAAADAARTKTFTDKTPAQAGHRQRRRRRR